MAVCRGSGNASMQHFYEPTVMVDRSGQKHWEFWCCFCTWYVKPVEKLYGNAHIKLTNSMHSFPRTIDGTNINFDMEPKLPKLNNLAGHVLECKGAKDDNEKTEPSSTEQINLKQSAEMMEAYLKEGELNPEVVATYKGFLHIFSAWIIDESLPWTAGDALTLQMLF